MKGMKGWFYLISSIIVLGVVAYAVYRVRDYIPALGMVIIVSVGALFVLGVLFVLILLARLAFKRDTTNIGQYGTLSQWMWRVEVYKPERAGLFVNSVPAQIARPYVNPSPASIEEDDDFSAGDTQVSEEPVYPPELPTRDSKILPMPRGQTVDSAGSLDDQLVAAYENGCNTDRLIASTFKMSRWDAALHLARLQGAGKIIPRKKARR